MIRGRDGAGCCVETGLLIRDRWGRGAAAHQPVRDRAPFGEAEPVVEGLRALVGEADVQEGRFAAPEDAFADLRHQPPRETSPQVIRVRTHRAHLAPRSGVHPLARHRGETRSVIDPEIAPHLGRPRPEVFRVDECGQLQHVGEVRRCQRDHLRGGGRWKPRGPYHLRQRSVILNVQPGRSRRRRADAVEVLAGCEQARQRGRALRVRVADRGEGRNLRRVARGSTVAAREPGVMRVECLPDRIVERMGVHTDILTSDA